MSTMLNFRSATASITRKTNVGSRGSAANCFALGINTMLQRGARRGMHQQHASMVLSSSSFHPVTSSWIRTDKNSRKKPSQQALLRPPFGLQSIASSSIHHAKRSLSFYDDPPGSGQQLPNVGAPAYTVYGEEIAFSLKAIPPEFRILPSGTVILDASKRGRLLFEWTPMAGGHDENSGYGNKRYRWDAATRFALTAEEAGNLLARLDRGDSSIEFSRRVNGEMVGGSIIDKVFIAKTIKLESGEKAEAEAVTNDGISLLVDYVDPDTHQLGQIPHPQPPGGGDAFGADGMKGPFEIRLMLGEYQVLRSLIEYSIPKLVGWSTMFDRNIEQAIAKCVQGGGNKRGGGGSGGGGSPHNYQGGGGGGGSGY